MPLMSELYFTSGPAMPLLNVLFVIKNNIKLENAIMHTHMHKHTHTPLITQVHVPLYFMTLNIKLRSIHDPLILT